LRGKRKSPGDEKLEKREELKHRYNAGRKRKRFFHVTWGRRYRKESRDACQKMNRNAKGRGRIKTARIKICWGDAQVKGGGEKVCRKGNQLRRAKKNGRLKRTERLAPGEKKSLLSFHAGDHVPGKNSM